MPAPAPPAAIAATLAMTHSGRLNPRSETVPPTGSPSARSALAARRTSRLYSRQLMGSHAPLTLV